MKIFVHLLGMETAVRIHLVHMFQISVIVRYKKIVQFKIPILMEKVISVLLGNHHKSELLYYLLLTWTKVALCMIDIFL